MVPKHAVITGGASGIGLQIAGVLSAKNIKVTVLDSDLTGLNALEKNNSEIDCQLCDISDETEVKAAVEMMIKKQGYPDLLINNAAYIHSEPLIKMGTAGFECHARSTWEKTINTNINGTFNVSALIVLAMAKMRIRGLVINMTSICSEGNAGQSAYSASKSALNAMTVAWAKELAPYKIRVAGLAPGYVATERTLSSVSEAHLNDIVSKTGPKRLGKSEEIVSGIEFIIQNDYFTGRILQIDGGLRI